MTKTKLVPVLVGQLLVEAGMLEKSLLELALERARESDVKIGQVLLYSGLVADRDLKAALSAQRMLRQSLISFRQAVDALRSVKLYKMPYEVALARARWLTTSEQTHQFARILLDASIIDIECLGPALAVAVCQNIPLGRVLVMHGQITADLRRTVLDALVLVRCSEITYDHAVAALRAVKRTGRDIRELLGLEPSSVTAIGDELVLWDVLSIDEVYDITEQTLQREANWRAPMVSKTIVANLKFAASLSINKKMSDRSLTVREAQLLCNELHLSTASVLKHIEALPAPEIQLIA